MQIKFMKLGEIATYYNGYPFKPSQWNKIGLPIIRIQNLNNPSLEYNFFNGEIDERYRVSKGDILISWSASIDVFEWEGPDAVLNQHIFKVKFDKVNINKSFFKYMVSISLQKAIQFSHGSTMKHLTKGNFDSILIPVPSLEIQNKISELLDQAKELMKKRKEQIEAFDELVKGLFHHMFGDVNANVYNFELTNIENIAIKITDGDHSTPIRSSNGIKLLSARNIKNSFIDLDAGVDYVSSEEYERMVRRCNPEYGDILISCSGTIGRVTRVNITEPFVLVRSVALVKLKPEGINPIFLERCLQTPYVQAIMNRSANKSSQANLFNNQIKKIPIILPSLDEQNRFAEQVEKIEQQKQLLQKSLTELENNFNALMQRAFKGELF